MSEPTLGDVVKEATADVLSPLRGAVRSAQASLVEAGARVARSVEVVRRTPDALTPEQGAALDNVAAWLRAADYERELAGEFPGYRAEGLGRADKLQRMALDEAAMLVGVGLQPI